MKKVMFVLFLFLFASSASATVYKWVDDKGVLNFADDLEKVPPAYRDSVEEIKTPAIPSRNAESQRASTSAPPIGQVLVREGDFAIKLTEVLKVGQPQNEAGAENILASIGISPKNGWIADYPVTPDIIGELQNALSGAADSGKLTMKKDEALKVFQDLVAQQGLPVRADERPYPGVKQPGAEVAPPQNYPEYYEPSEVENYYYDQGPPIVTYYPPPWDYSYLYAWVPYPFWWSGFWFPGFFVLHDFHRDIHHGHDFHHGTHGYSKYVSNHFRDPTTGRFGTIDPVRRHLGNAAASTSNPSRGVASAGSNNGASSIVRRSLEHASNRPAGEISSNRGSGGVSTPRTGVSSVRPSTGYRAPSSSYPTSRAVPSVRPAYGGSSMRSFSYSGMRTARSFSTASKSGGSGFRSSGFGSRGSTGGGSRGFSGGGSKGFSGRGGGRR